MPDDINELDVTDAGLKGIFGDRFHDETEPVRAKPQKVSANTTHSRKVAEKPKDEPVEAQWEPTKEHTWMDGLISCAKWALLFGGLSLLIFYWKQSGLMAESIAVPCIAVCTALGGFGVGKNAMKGNL